MDRTPASPPFSEGMSGRERAPWVRLERPTLQCEFHFPFLPWPRSLKATQTVDFITWCRWCLVRASILHPCFVPWLSNLHSRSLSRGRSDLIWHLVREKKRDTGRETERESVRGRDIRRSGPPSRMKQCSSRNLDPPGERTGSSENVRDGRDGTFQQVPAPGTPFKGVFLV